MTRFLITIGLSLMSLSATAFAQPGDAENPFARFIGTWTLKDDAFSQVWDGETVEHLTIPNHVTTCGPVNTRKSVLCVVDAGGFNGHILWAWNDTDSTFSHLSHFGDARLGVGTGALDAGGNTKSEIEFSDEPSGTYRIYQYTWNSDDEYEMMSRQYREDGSPTGNWYGGTWVRMAPTTGAAQ